MATCRRRDGSWAGTSSAATSASLTKDWSRLRRSSRWPRTRRTASLRLCSGMASAVCPAVLVYRFLNTADAQMGYRDPAREWLGKCAARLDDLANLIPSRLTALLIVASAPIAGGKWGLAGRIWRRDARKTASPNAGQPMSAAAGGLGVELEKKGQYRLGEGLRSPKVHDIRRGQRLFGASIVLGVVAAGSALFLAAIVKGYFASNAAEGAPNATREAESG